MEKHEKRKEDIIEDARRAREARKRQRDLVAPAVVVQRVWRGRKSRIEEKKAARLQVEKKLSDIGKVRSFVKKDFKLPAKVAASLAREATFGRISANLDAVCQQVADVDDASNEDWLSAMNAFFRYAWRRDDLSRMQIMSAKEIADRSICFRQGSFWQRESKDIMKEKVTKGNYLLSWSKLSALSKLPGSNNLEVALLALPKIPFPDVVLGSVFYLPKAQEKCIDLVFSRSQQLSESHEPIRCLQVANYFGFGTDLILLSRAMRAIPLQTLKALVREDDIVLCWETSSPIVLPRWLRDRARRIVDPGFLRMLCTQHFSHEAYMSTEEEVSSDDDDEDNADDDDDDDEMQLALSSNWAKKLEASITSMLTKKKKKKKHTLPRQQKKTTTSQECQALATFLWRLMECLDDATRFRALNALAFHPKIAICRVLYNGAQWRLDDPCTLAYALLVKHALIVSSDKKQMKATGLPVRISELRLSISKIISILITACSSSSSTTTVEACLEIDTMAALVRQVHARSTAALKNEDRLLPLALWQTHTVHKPKESILKYIPFVLPFKERAKLVLDAVSANPHATESLFTLLQQAHGGEEEEKIKTKLKIRRGFVLEDGMAHISRLSRKQLRGRLAITFIDACGRPESGVDAGGLFKEFWTELAKAAFAPSMGLFKSASDGSLYPHPDSDLTHGPSHLDVFHFLGRVLGKAIAEGITISPRFNRAFLAFVARGGGFDYTQILEDLRYMDPDLHKNLKFLTLYDSEQVQYLDLTFSVTYDRVGTTCTKQLIPKGDTIDVTASNRLAYVQRVAKFHLVDRLAPQANAFVQGLNDAIDLGSLTIFSIPELQLIISGAQTSIDIDNLQKYTNYENFNHILPSDRKLLARFWKVAKALTPKDKANLLKFVTSCERPPPLGFASLQPPFTIRKIPLEASSSSSSFSFFSPAASTSSSSKDRLPSASTCFNLLKLPAYASEDTIKKKLLLAIRSNSGFDLS